MTTKNYSTYAYLYEWLKEPTIAQQKYLGPCKPESLLDRKDQQSKKLSGIG